jgi:hypothetical protein
MMKPMKRQLALTIVLALLVIFGAEVAAVASPNSNIGSVIAKNNECPKGDRDDCKK